MACQQAMCNLKHFKTIKSNFSRQGDDTAFFSENIWFSVTEHLDLKEFSGHTLICIVVSTGMKSFK